MQKLVIHTITGPVRDLPVNDVITIMQALDVLAQTSASEGVRDNADRIRRMILDIEKGA